MRNASAFLFDRKFHFLSNKKDVDAHSRNVDVAWRQPRSARVCALAHTFLYNERRHSGMEVMDGLLNAAEGGWANADTGGRTGSL